MELNPGPKFIPGWAEICQFKPPLSNACTQKTSSPVEPINKTRPTETWFLQTQASIESWDLSKAIEVSFLPQKDWSNFWVNLVNQSGRVSKVMPEIKPAQAPNTISLIKISSPVSNQRWFWWLIEPAK